MNDIIPPFAPANPRASFRERGVSLVFAMMTVLALSLAAVALVRSVDTGALVIGNLSFKQETVMVSDRAANTAIDWLKANIASATLHNDSNSVDGNGYYASNKNSLDPTSVNTTNERWIDWKADSCTGLSSSVSDRCLTPSKEVDLGNKVKARYVIFRLCSGPGDAKADGSTLACAKPLRTKNKESGEHNAISYNEPPGGEKPGLAQYFRIVVRTVGGRNTVSYIDTVVHF